MLTSIICIASTLPFLKNGKRTCKNTFWDGNVEFYFDNVQYAIIDYDPDGWNKNKHGWEVFSHKCKEKGMDHIDANDALELRRYRNTNPENIWQKMTERRVFWLADQKNPIGKL